MTKAEEKARIAFDDEWPDSLRLAYIEGYLQAEKDLALTWEDIREICKLSVIVEVDKGREISDEHHYGEVLRRFNEKRKEK